MKDPLPIITAEDAPSSDDLRAVHEGLNGYNAQRWASHFQPLAVFGRDGRGRIVAGLDGYTAGDWLTVQWLWVHDDLRGCGVGRKVLALAEARAIERGCHAAWLDTFSFQAPGFYRKLGYEVFATLAYPPDTTRYFLRKRLAPSAPGAKVGPAAESDE